MMNLKIKLHLNPFIPFFFFFTTVRKDSYIKNEEAHTNKEALVNENPASDSE